MLVLAQPITEGFVAACARKFGEGPVALALDGTTAGGRPARTNPVSDGPATYVRIGPRPAPYLIFLPARADRPRPHLADVEAWRDGRYAALRRDLGWLTLTGLDWLSPGDKPGRERPDRGCRASRRPADRREDQGGG